MKIKIEIIKIVIKINTLAYILMQRSTATKHLILVACKGKYWNSIKHKVKTLAY